MNSPQDNMRLFVSFTTLHYRGRYPSPPDLERRLLQSVIECTIPLVQISCTRRGREVVIVGGRGEVIHLM